MTVDEYTQDAQTSADWLRKELASMFDRNYTISVKSPSSNTGIMSKSFWVSVWNVPENSTDLQRLNCKMQLKFVMHLTDGGGRQQDMSKFEFECMTLPVGAKQKGLTYRKVSGKTVREATTKLFAWIKKNEITLKEYGV